MTETRRNSVWLHRFATLTACATFLLIIAGALVTSNEAGLSVPDWPLSYGRLMPPMVGGVLYEHGHRMVATFVGLLTVVLAVWLARREARRWVRRLGWVALGAVIVQGILGGITVLLRLPIPVSVAHACLAQAFFAMTVTLALVTAPSWEDRPPRAEDTASPPLLYLAVGTTAAIFLQLLLGAAFRHSGLGIVPHVVGAGVVAACALWTTSRVLIKHSNRQRLSKLALAFLGLLGVQIVLGVGSYLMRLEAAEASRTTTVLLTTAHVALGALLLVTMLAIALESQRGLSIPEKTGRLSESSLQAGV